MWALVIVEVDPLSNACLRLRSGLPTMQVDAFVFQGPPQAFDTDEIEQALSLFLCYF